MSSVNRSSQHVFAENPKVHFPRSKFNMSYGGKTTFNEGTLFPIMFKEVLPGDTFNLKPHFFSRLATPIKPFMDNLYFDWQFFFVPNRIVWNNWEKFQGAQDNPGDSIDFVIPSIDFQNNTILPQTVFDYFGLPGNVPIGATSVPVNALPFRALTSIWNHWYRDQNLQNSLTLNLGDGPDVFTLYDITKYVRNKRHDYFTSALTRPQKGNAVLIPMGGTAPLAGTLSTPDITVTRVNNAGVMSVRQAGSNTLAASGTMTSNVGSWTNSSTNLSLDPNGGLIAPQTSLNFTGLGADLSLRANDVVGTINNLRTAMQIQVLLERDNRGGTRYKELLLSQFGVVSPDARLQWPEYLGGGTTRMNVNPVTQTGASVTNQTPQGNLAAFGVMSSHGSGGFVKSFVEHGHIIGLASVRADYTYQNRLDKMWSRRTRYDFYMPALANLSEQPIYNREIMFTNDATDNQVWGYAERWAEYRFSPSIISGYMKSFPNGSPYQSLDIWHLAEDFTTRPNLNSTFITEKPPISRVVAVPSEPHFLLDYFYELTTARVMPLYSVPFSFDRF